MNPGFTALHGVEDSPVARSEPFQLLDQICGVGHLRRLLAIDPPRVDGDALNGVQDGRANRNRVRGEQTRGVAEQAESVTRGDHQLESTGLRFQPDPRTTVDLDRSGQADVDQLRDVEPAALVDQQALGDVGQPVDQLGAPWCPCGWPGCAGVGFGEEAEQIEDIGPPVHRLDQGRLGGRVAVVPLGGQQREGQVLADQPLDQTGVARTHPHRQHRLAGDRRADRGVLVARPGQLADVVEERGQEQQIGTVDPGQMLLHLGDGLHRVPVDGVLVDRVVLRPRPDRVPAGDPAGDTARQVQRLPHRHEVGAGRQHVEERLPRRRRPGDRERRGMPAEVVGGHR